jgi:hypothetical protein
MIDRTMHRIRLTCAILAAATLALAACATVPVESAHQAAVADHATCSDQGYEFPSNRYTGCRYQLAESRQQRAWQNLQMLRAPRIDQGPEALHTNAYRPLSRDAFRCTQRETTDGVRWIHCDT